MNAEQIRKARHERERASACLDDAHTNLREAVVAAVRQGMGPKEAAEHAGVSRQAVHSWLR